MAASMVFYNSWIEKVGEAVNLESDAFKVGLTTSSYTPDAATHDELADITNELSGSGYARQDLDGSYTNSSGTCTFDAADTVFTASGGTITARYYFIYDDTVSGDPLVCYGLLDTTPANVSVTDGNTLTIQWNASGIFTIAKV